jgi:membrane protease subunit (stomatin/prohibitin family)
MAAFVNEGKLADLYTPGTYTLETQNMPILSTLRGWKYGFESPFKAEVYFVSTRTFTDRKWGTKNPIMMRDAEFGPVRLRAFGTFSIKVGDAAILIRSVVGTDGRFSVEEIGEQLRDLVVARFADVLGESKIPALDLASNYDDLGKFLTARMAPDFANFGLQLVTLTVENISLPPEVEQAMDKRTSMGVIGNLQQYTQYQTANAIGDAARQPGGLAGSAAGIGAGFAMANQMSQAIAGAGQAQQPPPVPGQAGNAYFIAIDGQQKGPLTPDQLKAEIAANRITRQTLVWKNGMTNWTALETLPELANLLSNVPPPLPR